MPQIFRPSADTRLRALIVLAVLVVLGAVLAGGGYFRSSWSNAVGWPLEQPVPFSHRHHAGDLAIACRYCHAAVEVSASAGFPPTHTCMTCHSQIWTGAPMLAPVRRSLATGEPLAWRRVAKLPDFVYFEHAAHIDKGVGCETCHGDLRTMPLVWRAKSLQMQWCLACHRDPGPRLRPMDRVFDHDWVPPEGWAETGRRLVAERAIRPERLTDCYTCHR